MNRRGLILSVLALGAAGFGGATWFANRPGPVAEAEPVAPELAEAMIRPYSPILGPADAPVTIVEFFDPACGTCKDFYPFVKHLMEANPGKIKLVMRYTPFHNGSDEVVKILDAAHLQNKFWDVLEETYATQSAWAINHTAHPEKLWTILT